MPCKLLRTETLKCSEENEAVKSRTIKNWVEEDLSKLSIKQTNKKKEEKKKKKKRH